MRGVLPPVEGDEVHQGILNYNKYCELKFYSPQNTCPNVVVNHHEADSNIEVLSQDQPTD